MAFPSLRSLFGSFHELVIAFSDGKHHAPRLWFAHVFCEPTNLLGSVAPMLGVIEDARVRHLECALSVPIQMPSPWSNLLGFLVLVRGLTLDCGPFSKKEAQFT